MGTIKVNNTTNNVAVNNKNTKGGIVMDKKVKDYTLGGKLTATNWKEFRTAMKDAGIAVGTKSYAQLTEEYNALPKENDKPYTSTSANEVSVGDLEITKDNAPQEVITAVSEETTEQINNDKLGILIPNILKASFKATRGDSKGLIIITMRKLFGIIREAYATGNEQLDDVFIKNVINELCKQKYLTCKRYESGALMFYPTVKVRDYKKEVK